MEDSPNLLDWIKDTMNKLIEETRSCFAEGEIVVAAVSGGADSMVMLDCLINCGLNLKITVAHFNHCLRGSESDGDEEFVRDFCKQKDIPFVSKRVDIGKLAKETKESTELCGRNQRYDFLKSLEGRICVAHTLSDCAETMLFNLTRGSGLAGLCSIPKENKRVIRPLLYCTRDEIEKYCRENNLSYRNDSSNESDEYSRNFIRHNVISNLKKVNSAFEAHVKNTVESLKEDRDYIDSVVCTEFDKVNKDGGLDVNVLSKLHPSISKRILAKFLSLSEIQQTSYLLIKLNDLCRKGKGKEELPNGYTAAIRKGILYLDEPFFDCEFEKNVEFTKDKEGKLCFSYKSFLFILSEVSKCNQILNNIKCDFISSLDYDKINGNVLLRSRLPGDKVKFLNRPTKSVKKLINEKGLSPKEKSGIIFMTDDKDIIWISGFGATQKTLPDECTKNVLMIFNNN